MIDVPSSIEDVLALPAVSFLDRGRLPNAPGMYFVVAERAQIIYVGIARTSLAKRWRRHHKRPVFEGDVIHYMVTDAPGMLRAREADAISRWRPLYNYQPPYLISRDVIDGKTVFTKLAIEEGWRRVQNKPVPVDPDEDWWLDE